jgi:hypothetical protein
MVNKIINYFENLNLDFQIENHKHATSFIYENLCFEIWLNLNILFIHDKNKNTDLITINLNNDYNFIISSINIFLKPIIRKQKLKDLL